MVIWGFGVLGFGVLGFCFPPLPPLYFNLGALLKDKERGILEVKEALKRKAKLHTSFS